MRDSQVSDDRVEDVADNENEEEPEETRGIYQQGKEGEGRGVETTDALVVQFLETDR